MEMGLRDVLSGVLNRYLPESRSRLVDSDIRGGFSDVVRVCLPPDGEYLVKGSAGIGSRAQIPMLCIFDSRVTDKASLGFYLVYLFKTDMTGVYLSLNQAWTPFSRQGSAAIGRENIRRVSERIWDSLRRRRDVPAGLRTSIDLACSGHNDNLARGYEQGHICGLYYAAGSLPDETRLVEDLEGMLRVYASLVEMFMGTGETDPLSGYQAVIPEVCGTDRSLSRILHESSVQPSADAFKEVAFPGSGRRESARKPGESVPFKPDYELRQKRNTQVGTKGEKYAVKLLKQWYPSCKVERVSEKDDSKGYDILVTGFDSGEELHVEVKSTNVRSEHAPFFISDKELERARTDGEGFMLLRLFNLDAKHPGYYKIKGAEVAQLTLTPKSYQAEIL